MNEKEALFSYCLRIADTNLILSQRLGEWCGAGPFLEEDLALTNIALDLLGQANSVYQYASRVEGKGRSEDDLVFLRNEREYYNTLITELPNGDFARTILRQVFCDVFNFYFYSALSESKDETLSALAKKSIKEVTYHLRHSTSWAERLGDGTEESATRLKDALDYLFRFTGDMFEMNASDLILVQAGIAVDLKKIKSLWETKVKEIFQLAKLEHPSDTFMNGGSRVGKHTENLGFLLAEMQSLPRALPDAKW